MLAANTAAEPESQEKEPEQANNIVIFPKPFRVPPTRVINKVFRQEERFARMHADLIADNVVEFLFSTAQNSDIPLTMSTDDEMQHFTMMLVAEATKAAICQVYGLRHPLHPVCRDLFAPQDSTEEQPQ